MTKTAAVDVVVVAYNSGSTLPTCIASLEGDPAVGRVIVVDNCSTDGSADVAEALGAAVIRSPRNDGFGAGCNLGVAASDTPFVLLLNPDASVASGTVIGLHDALAAHPDAAAVASTVVDHHGTAEPVRRRFPSPWRAPLEPGATARLDERWYARREPRGGVVDWLSAACLLIRREAFDAVGGFDERYFLYSEETDLCARWGDAGWVVRWVPDLPARHVGGASTGALPGQGKVAWVEGYLRFARTHCRHPWLLRVGVAVGFASRVVLWTVLGRPELRRRYAAATRRAATGGWERPELRSS